MAEFICRLGTPAGEVVTRTVEAAGVQEARVRLETRSKDAVVVTSAGVYAQNEAAWTPWLRTQLGIRFDGTRGHP